MGNERERLLRKCPVCQSTDLQQETRDMLGLAPGEFVRLRFGSHCRNCGTRNIRNSKTHEAVRAELRKALAQVQIIKLPSNGS